MRRWMLALLVLGLGCSSPPDGSAKDAGPEGTDAGSDSGQGAWAITPVTGAADLLELDMAVSADGRVGIAYFVNVGTADGGTITNYELRYQEWNGSAVTPPETVRVVQRMYGLDVAFQPNGQPAIAYLGGDGETGMGPSAYWYQSDAAISRRAASGQWSEEVVTRMSNEAPAGNPVSDVGFLVGLNPALAFDGSRTWLAWRDVHFGQNTQGDWAGSDLEIAGGSEGAWDKWVVIAGGNDKQAWGGHLDLVLANGQPAIASDQAFGAADAPGQNLVFSRRKADGTWGAPVRPIATIGNTQTGPSLAYDPTLGFAIAVTDKTEDALYFTRSVNDGVTWSEAQPVYQSGTGGWYPSLSINPETHDPSIAFYICSRAAGRNEGSCTDSDDRLVVTERIGGIWRDTTVDESGGWHPKLAHLADSRRVVVYRNPKSGAINLAVEQ